MAIVFHVESNGNIRIDETGKASIWLLGQIHAVMSVNDAGTMINVRDGDFNITFSASDVTSIANVTGPFTIETATAALSEHCFKK